MSEGTIIQSLKFAFAAAGGVLVHILGGGDDLLVLFGALLGFDFLLGVLKGLKTSAFKSAVVRWGAVNKALEVILIMIFNLFDRTMHTDIFRNGTIIWFCVCEGASVIENLVLLGVPCPDGLQKVITKLKVGISINFIDIFNKLLDEKFPAKKGEDHHENH